MESLNLQALYWYIGYGSPKQAGFISTGTLCDKYRNPKQVFFSIIYENLNIFKNDFINN